MISAAILGTSINKQEMMKMANRATCWIVIKSGHDIEGILGVYLTESDSIREMKIAAGLELDNFHLISVHTMDLGASVRTGENIVGWGEPIASMTGKARDLEPIHNDPKSPVRKYGTYEPLPTSIYQP